MSDATPAEGPAILLVAPDDALRYLMERYARRGGFVLRAPTAVGPEADRAGQAARTPDGRSAAVAWVSSIRALEAFRPREEGLLGEDTPLIVIASDGEAARARELGADHRVAQPFTYQDFLAALAAVGVAP